MSSGVGVSDDCVTKFNELKLGHSLKYIIYKLSDDLSTVVIEKTAEPGASYDNFVNDLPPNECRYAVYDFDFDLGESGKRNKILFVLWAPDAAKIKHKMVLTSSKADFRKKLVGVAIEIQATDRGEIDYNTVLEKAKQSK